MIRLRVWVCVWIYMWVCVWIYMCVCERERERERKRVKEKKGLSVSKMEIDTLISPPSKTNLATSTVN